MIGLEVHIAKLDLHFLDNHLSIHTNRCLLLYLKRHPLLQRGYSLFFIITLPDTLVVRAINGLYMYGNMSRSSEPLS